MKLKFPRQLYNPGLDSVDCRSIYIFCFCLRRLYFLDISDYKLNLSTGFHYHKAWCSLLGSSICRVAKWVEEKRDVIVGLGILDLKHNLEHLVICLLYILDSVLPQHKDRRFQFVSLCSMLPWQSAFCRYQAWNPPSPESLKLFHHCL